ncbi:RUS family member 1 isoform X1 [Colias croceus]|uniref:RUS family member 1 isoform X1 n=2 Tax=Colias crocea TaxID=72248 RepID=UPI001E27DDC7|nr:RUS family member 1 isoform X1 [Colias croceus]
MESFDPAPMEGELLLQERYGTRQRFYVQPPGQNRILVCETQKANWILAWLKEIFLPQGFPDSISMDYLEYQVFDTAQAFCSTITGILATKEVMTGVGVGDIAATPLAATVTWVLKDGCGHLGRILFAYTHGSQLDAYCKTWRLYADIMNDVAMVIELTLPFYFEYTTAALCCSTTLKAIVGVAGGATRTALTQHHAKRSNLADVTAKDAAQETAVNLFASVIAILILTYCGTSFGLYLFLIMTHLACNYCAVKAICLDTFNPPRFMLSLDPVLKLEQFAAVQCVNYTEPLFPFFKPRMGEMYCGFKIKLGSSAQGSVLNTTPVSYFKKLLEAYKTKPFVPFLNLPDRVMNVLLKDNARPVDVLEGYYHGILFILATLTINDISIPFPEFAAVFNESEWASVRARHGGSFERELSYQAIDFLQQLLSLEWVRVQDGLEVMGWNVHRHQMLVEEWRHHAEELFDDFAQEVVELEPPLTPPPPLATLDNPIAARAFVNGRWNTARAPTRNSDYIRDWVKEDMNDEYRVVTDDDYGVPGPSGLHRYVYTPPSDDDDSYSD